MREIIFRGQQVQGSFITGHYYVNEEGKHLICFTEKRHRFYGETMEYGEYQVAPETIGQYTGLRDSTKWENLTSREQEEWLSSGKTKKEWQGRKIFEGDIVELTNDIPDETYQGIITFDDFEWAIDAGDDLESLYNQVIHCEKTIEVIGNVHDNSELLEVGKNG